MLSGDLHNWDLCALENDVFVRNVLGLLKINIRYYQSRKSKMKTINSDKYSDGVGS